MRKTENKSSAARKLAAGLALALVAAGIRAADAVDPMAPPTCAAQLPPGVPAARIAALSRGFNLTSWLEGPAPRHPDMTLLRRLYARGFTHVRLPVAPERLMAEFSEPDEIARQAQELDRAIDELSAIGFAISLDVHPGERVANLYKSDPERAFALIEELWRTLARRYAGRLPDRLFFEVLNEPNIDQRTWNRDGPRLVAAIRSEAPAHTIIYGGTHYQRIDALDEVQPVKDANVVYAVHFYDPMVFTHQGLDWAPDDPLSFIEGMPFPARFSDPAVEGLFQTLVLEGHATAAAKVALQLRQPWNEERIDAEFAPAQKWAVSHRTALIVNEFGVLSWKAAPSARARWIKAVRGAAERHCIGWAHWDYADGFGFVRRFEDGQEHADEAIVSALLDR
jgi:endoglucanase